MNHDEENLNLPPHPPDGLELMCAGILATEFGRQKSEALAKAVAQLAAVESPEISWRQRMRARWLTLPALPRFAFASVCILIIGLMAWTMWPRTSTKSATVASISGELNAQWASKNFKNGDALAAGNFRLASGVVELTFNSKARVAVEGPAQFKLSDTHSIELRAGKLSAEVPPPAHGFSVKMPNATVVDLGTRFGVNVSNDMSEVDVFEGKVMLTPLGGSDQLLTQKMAVTVDSNRATKPATFSEKFYPAVSVTRTVHPVNCGFDGPGNMEQGGLPSGFNYWSGPAFTYSMAESEVTPLEGRGMMRFQSPGAGKNSEVWQMMDLRPYKALLAKGDVEIKSLVWFNRIRGDADSANKFGLTIAAFSGQSKNIAQLWERRNESALAIADKEFISDDDPATWEKLEVSTALPPKANFLVVEMRAIASTNGDANSNPFPGHFADLIDCTFYEPLRAGSSNR